MRAARIAVVYRIIPAVVPLSEPPVARLATEVALPGVTPVAQHIDTLADTIFQSADVRRAAGRGFVMNLRTNGLMDIAALPNLGAEFYLGRGWTVGLDGVCAWWSRPSRNRYWRLQGGELWGRKYLGRRLFAGHHVGVYGQILRYDFCTGFESTGYLSGGPGSHFDYRPTWGVGVEYGYTLPIGRRMRLDFSLGVGYLTGRYVTYFNYGGHNVWETTRTRQWIGPTRAEVSFVWIIGKGGDR